MEFEEVIELLTQILEDTSLPKGIRTNLQATVVQLQNGDDVSMKCDKSLQILDDLSNDPNIPSYARTQLWNIVSMLESTR